MKLSERMRNYDKDIMSVLKDSPQYEWADEVTQLEAELRDANGEIELLSQGEATTMLVDRLIKLGWRPPNMFTKLEEFWRRLRFGD